MLLNGANSEQRSWLLVYLISFLACCVITMLRMWVYEYYSGLNLVSLTILGGLFLGSSLKLVFSGEDIFSPLSIYYFFGWIFFYWAPLNQIVWDFWPSLTADGMDDWVSVWGWFCILGYIVVGFFLRIPKYSGTKNTFSIDYYKFTQIFYLLSAVCILSQVIVLIKFGGISGLVSAYEMRIEEGLQGYNPSSGFGFLFTFSESYPNLLAIYIVVKYRHDERFKLLRYFMIYMFFLFVVNMFFGGLRGSRSTTIWSMFWAAAIYHFMVSRISLRLIFIGVLLLATFMSAYSLYKFGGVDGLKGLYDSEIKTQIYESRYVSDADKLVVVRDASRADVQAYVLREYFDNDMALAYGRSLIAGAFSFVPSFVMPSKPDTFVREKTSIFIGEWYFSDSSYTTLLTGLFGEFVVNFGPFFGMTYFALFGLFIGWLSQVYRNMHRDDGRRYLLPVLLLCVIQFMMSDSNVISQFLFRYMLLPGLLIYLSCYKRPAHETYSPVQ